MPIKDIEARRAYFRAYNKALYARNMQRAQEYKLEKGCADCGYNAHHAALEFDHVEEKTCNVSRLYGSTWNAILKEIAKCEVVCSNCHSIRTFERKHTP